MIDNVQETVFRPMLGLWAKVVEFLPNIVAAVLLLLIGYFVARIIGAVIAKLLEKVGLDRITERSGIASAVQNSGIDASASKLFGKIIYWLIFLTFMISAADTLGLPRVSSTIDDFVLYLPKLLGALLVVIIGLFAAHLVRTAIETAAASMNIEYARAIGTMVYSVMVIIIGSLAIGQLEIETELLNQVISIVLLAVVGSVALSLGIGTRKISSSIIAGVYARDLFEPGDTIAIGDTEGEVIEVGTTNTVLEVSDGTRLTVPNQDLIDQQVRTIARA